MTCVGRVVRVWAVLAWLVLTVFAPTAQADEPAATSPGSSPLRIPPPPPPPQWHGDETPRPAMPVVPGATGPGSSPLRIPPPPPPPRWYGEKAPRPAGPVMSPVLRAPATPRRAAPASAPPTPAVALGYRTWSGKALPCRESMSSWSVRLVGGWPLYTGTDAPDPRAYWGLDVGRIQYGCWGLDVYYRHSSAAFDRSPTVAIPIVEDDGITHHLGGKLTYQRDLGICRSYAWGGLGAGYYTTQDHVDDASGFEAYGEFGFGYVIRPGLRLRLGVNVHFVPDTMLSRRLPTDHGQGRDLWLIAPVLQLEVDF